jgi:hypothetical protein
MINRLHKRIVRRAYRRARHRLLSGWRSLERAPIFFANSFPKSGTHLLTQVLEGFTRLGPAVNSGLPPILTYEGPTGIPRSRDEIMRDLHRLLPGDIAFGHLHALPETMEFLCRDGVIPYFILRDPRDVVVSHAYYVTEMSTAHVHHDYYARTLQTMEERIKVSITGRPEIEIPFPDICGRFEPYVGWLDRPEVLSLHFEDFIHNRQEILGRVLDHALGRGFPLQSGRESAIRTLLESIDPQSSPTFRSGKTGAWRDQFTPEHKALFKEVTGDLLIRLGYEDDDLW